VLGEDVGRLHSEQRRHSHGHGRQAEQAGTAGHGVGLPPGRRQVQTHQVVRLEEVITGLGRGTTVLRAGGDAPAPVLGGPPVSLGHFVDPPSVRQAAVEFACRPPVHEYRRWLATGIGGQQAGGGALGDQAVESGGPPALAAGEEQAVVTDR
jgi:hypothetical protein